VALAVWHGVGGRVVALRSIKEGICRSGTPAPLFHTRATATTTTDWVSSIVERGCPLVLLIELFGSLNALEGEWHELETKREKARKRKREAAG